MNLLFISEKGKLLGLAYKCQSEGHTVSLYVEDEANAFVGNGVVDKSPFSKHLLRAYGSDCIASSINQLLDLHSPDLIVVDSFRLGKVADYLREGGRMVLGSGYWANTLSTSASYQHEILKRVGVPIWSGKTELDLWVGGWWNGISLISPFASLNEERFLTGNLGPWVESAGTVTFKLKDNCRLVMDSVLKMERLLRKTRFRGIISLCCHLTADTLTSSLITTSLFPLPSLLESYKGNITELTLSIASGRKVEGKFSTDHTLSIPISIPPYPLRAVSSTALTIEIGGVCSSNLKHLYLMDVMKEGETWYAAGGDGELMCVVARGRDVVEARKRAYKTISNLSVQDLQYRTDIGAGASVSLRKLENWGWLQ